MRLGGNEGVDTLRVAEFFAGIGLVGAGLEQEGFQVVFANDVEPMKREIYAANFDSAKYLFKDIRQLDGATVPQVEIATASFPCTDLSLAGGRRGLAGSESSLLWHFLRVIEEMGSRRPPVILIENVPGLATSSGGRDLHDAVAELNRLGYWCDLFLVDARWFVPQSRVRLFVVASESPAPLHDVAVTEARPHWMHRFRSANPELHIRFAPLSPIVPAEVALADVVDRLSHDDDRWWNEDHVGRFVESLSALQTERLRRRILQPEIGWATAYRRTRNGRPVWEVRDDDIAGCLRTARGGSSKQALVESGFGSMRARWMTPVEYARLQGAPNLNVDGVRVNQALFALGDAVCVPVVAWIGRTYLRPLFFGTGVPGNPRALLSHV